MKMELIAALLHSPSILFLDEPTIGLDVVAQASIRKCLREYNRDRQVTMLITSHYMQDIEALCDRVMVINHGRMMHDGRLQDIVDRLAPYKVVKLRFHNGALPENFDGMGKVLAVNPPTVTLGISRDSVAQQAARLLARFPIDDISVEDPPIEDVIGRMYQEDSAGNDAGAAEADRA
jgi:ABC-2 type transport system ATP-binding protein